MALKSSFLFLSELHNCQALIFWSSLSELFCFAAPFSLKLSVS